jgi:PKD repeat protein
MKSTVGIMLMLLLAFLIQIPQAHAAHPKPGEYGYRGVQFNPAMAGIPLLDYFTASPIKPAGPAVNGRYQGLAPFGTKASCNVCHYDIVANENMNRHATMSFNKIALPQYGWGYDKEKPWVSGPGKFGKWSPTYNRQLGHMNATYSSQTDLLNKLDLGAFEFTTECGVCHVGGGPATSNPYSFTFPWRVSDYFGRDRGPGGVHSNLDNDQRNQSIANDFNFPLPLSSPYYPLRVPLNPWDYFVTDSGVQKVDWAQWGMNGTLQLDCLMCHLQGYNHLTRNEEIVRNNRLYNAGTLGSGLAVLNPLEGDGFNMDYDASQVKVGSDGSLYLDFSFTDRITRFPKAENCVHCHMPTAVKNEPGADWKKGFYSYDAIPSDNPADPGNIKPPRYLSDLVKRGDTWKGDEVHRLLECAGCHTQTGKYQAWKPSDPNYMHSPGKGYDPMNTGSDEFGGTVKFCYDCHLLNGDLNGDKVTDMESFGAPDPNGAHTGAGLLAKIVSNARRINAQGIEEEFTGNHLDIISCTTCHIQKRYAAARSIDFSTGSQFFNFVGNPLDQASGPETVDLAYSWKETTPVKLLPNGTPNSLWRRLIYPFNYVTGIYWNNIGSTDANGDGFTTGMSNNGAIVVGDPFFQRNVKENFVYSVNAENNRVPVGLLNSSAFDAQSMKNGDDAVIFTRPSEIEAYKGLVTAKNAGFVPQLVLESEPYLIMHNILPASVFALGKTSTDSTGKKLAGCSDCHGGSGGIFNGQINMIGTGKRSDGSQTPISISWNNSSDVSTKALYWDKYGTKQTLSFSVPSTSPIVSRNPFRWEFLGYDNVRVSALNTVTPEAYGIGIDPVAAFAAGDPTTAMAGTSVTFTAAVPASAGFFTYTWIFGDGTTTTVTDGTRTVTKTYTTAGTYTLTLKVIDEEGKASIAMKAITVSPATTVVAVGTPVVTPASLVTAIPLNTLPVHNKVYVSWGDGTSMTIFNPHTAATIDLSHKYSRVSQYLVTPAAPAAPYYQYITNVKYYNGSSLVQQTNLTVKVNKNAETDGTYITTAVIP